MAPPPVAPFPPLWDNPPVTEDHREISAAIGDLAWRRLVRALGGESIRIPRRARSDSRLVTVIGPDAMASLGEIRGGEMVYIPSPHSARRRFG